MYGQWPAQILVIEERIDRATISCIVANALGADRLYKTLFFCYRPLF